MNKQAISVSLRRDNLLWLQAMKAGGPHRSVSEALDSLIADVRGGHARSKAGVRSVRGTIAIKKGLSLGREWAAVTETHSLLSHASLFSDPAFQSLDLTPEQVFLADEFRPNRDPFDALICAAARSLALPLVTRDTQIEESGIVRVTW